MNPNARILSAASVQSRTKIAGAAKADPSAQEDLMPVRRCSMTLSPD